MLRSASSSPGNGTIAIGDTISGGTPDSILYVDNSGNLAESSDLTFDINPKFMGSKDFFADEFNIFEFGSDPLTIYDGKSFRMRWQTVASVPQVTLDIGAYASDADLVPFRAKFYGDGSNLSNIDHGTLVGLADDDHTQYALLAGRSGGQSLIGGTALGDNLTLRSTSNATRGKVVFGNAGTTVYDEVNERFGFGISSPASKIHIDSGTATASYIQFTANATTGQTSTDGFHVGISSTGVAELRNRENTDLDIYVNNTRRASFPSSVSFGFWLPCSTAGTYWAFRTGGITSGFGYSLRYNDAADSLGYGAAYRHALQYSSGESFCIVNGSNYQIVCEDGGDVGICTGTGSVPARLTIVKTTEQLRVCYNTSNYFSVTVSSTGAVTFDGVGTSPSFSFSDAVTLQNVTISDTKNITLNTTTGTKIGTATTQKLGFWNATPIVQPTTAVAGATRVGGAGAAVTDTDTFDGYTIAQVVKALRDTGILA